MRQRQDINYGKDLTGAQIWAAYRREIHKIIAHVVATAKLPPELAPESDAVPA